MIHKIIENAARKIKGKDYILDKDIPTSYLIGMGLQRFSMKMRGVIASVGMKYSGKNLLCGNLSIFKTVINISFLFTQLYNKNNTKYIKRNKSFFYFYLRI